jgi:hypothetical protein
LQRNPECPNPPGTYNFWDVDDEYEGIWKWDKVQELNTVACRGEHAYEDCAGQCATSPVPFTDAALGEVAYKCQLADNGEVVRLQGARAVSFAAGRVWLFWCVCVCGGGDGP